METFSTERIIVLFRCLIKTATFSMTVEHIEKVIVKSSLSKEERNKIIDERQKEWFQHCFQTMDWSILIVDEFESRNQN